jgi:hypothetical protein
LLRAEAKELRDKARAEPDPVAAAKMLELAAELEHRATERDGKRPNGHT